MENKWGRDESYKWPSDSPVGMIAALVIALAVMSAGAFWNYEQWSPLQRYWLTQYLWTNWTMNANTNARMLVIVDANGKRYWPDDTSVTPGRTQTPDGKVIPLVLAKSNVAHGDTLRLLPRDILSTAWVKDRLSDLVYRHQTPTELAQGLIKWPGVGALAVFIIGYLIALPKDNARRQVLRYGRRLRGPELIAVADFNSRDRHHGIAFRLHRNWLQKLLGRSPQLHLPAGIESRHLLMVGDTGSGKSALIRQVLMQVEERGETAIVYDPALEYTPQFFNPERGDVILNPLDQRMPFWSPGDEIRLGAEALTLAKSLFPNQPHDVNSFFVKTPRDIFAHLLKLKPSPQELIWWMSHPEEIDRRTEGTEYAPMISREAPAQRNGVLASLNQVASSLRLLPTEHETQHRWNTIEWSQQCKGWLLLTSTPETREALLPLISLWLDTLVLRLMREEQPSQRRVWFVLDELASLQKLPQLEPALTENRKSNNPVVIGLQGKAQLETIYGHIAETMLSMLSTKIFLRTSEPRAADWISRAIGEVEIEQLRETRSQSSGPRQQESKSYQLERRIEPLVMASEMAGLPDRHGYLKAGNLVARLHFPYTVIPQREPKFIERKSAVILPPAFVAPPPEERKAQRKIEPQQQQERNEQQQLGWHGANPGEQFFE
jgi:type IV secretory pathway TraG/TraD family ATPase VirD4